MRCKERTAKQSREEARRDNSDRFREIASRIEGSKLRGSLMTITGGFGATEVSIEEVVNMQERRAN